MQPVNVGFSYSEGKGPTNSDDAAQDVHAFLQLFIQTYTKYATLPFTITGESYAGHYIPAIAHTIYDSNLKVKAGTAEKGVEDVNMVSLAIGNGLTDPLVQYEFYPDMVYTMNKSDNVNSIRLVTLNMDLFYLKKHVMKCDPSIQLAKT